MVTDERLVAAVRAVLAATPFHGEGYRQVRARLAPRGLRVIEPGRASLTAS